MQKLADNVTIPYPTQEKWVEFYTQWARTLTKALGLRHNEMDREDAVVSAFTKLMARRPENFPHHPDTEKGWYNCILWQAKGALSHLYESKTIREKHHKLAMEERLCEGICLNRCTIDGNIRERAAFETLFQLCSNAGIKSENVAAYCRCYLEGEDSKSVTKAFGITANNLYAIRFRIERLLAAKGRDLFRQKQRQAFLMAA